MSQVMSEYETNRALKSAKLTNIPSVARCWQLLLKGQEEMQKAFSVKEACEMVLLRIICNRFTRFKDINRRL